MNNKSPPDNFGGAFLVTTHPPVPASLEREGGILAS